MANQPRYEYEPRGLAVIFVNVFEGKKDVSRLEARKDLENMKNLFLYLDFKVEVYEDKNRDTTLNILKEARNKAYKKVKAECFVCVISSHGNDVHNVKTNTWTPGVYAGDLCQIDVNRMVQDFCNKSELYKDKPKLFFIQACRTRYHAKGLYESLRYDKGICIPKEVSANTADDNGSMSSHDSSDSLKQALPKESYPFKFKIDPDLAQFYETKELEHGEWDIHAAIAEAAVGGDAGGDNAKKDIADAKGRAEVSTGSNQMPDVPHDITLTECPKDCMIMFPVGAGRAALRNDNTIGSWMTHFMYEKREGLIENGKLLPFLTSVTDAMAKRDFEPKELEESEDKTAKCASVIMHRLTEEVIFVQKSETSVMAKQKRILLGKIKELQN